jgi:hypothetical protein
MSATLHESAQTGHVRAVSPEGERRWNAVEPYQHHATHARRASSSDCRRHQGEALSV